MENSLWLQYCHMKSFLSGQRHVCLLTYISIYISRPYFTSPGHLHKPTQSILTWLFTIFDYSLRKQNKILLHSRVIVITDNNLTDHNRLTCLFLQNILSANAFIFCLLSADHERKFPCQKDDECFPGSSLCTFKEDNHAFLPLCKRLRECDVILNEQIKEN